LDKIPSSTRRPAPCPGRWRWRHTLRAIPTQDGHPGWTLLRPARSSCRRHRPRRRLGRRRRNSGRAGSSCTATGATAGEPGRQQHWESGECLFYHYVFRKRMGCGPPAVLAGSGLRNGEQARLSSKPAKSIPGVRKE
jgi:hypothetical protein